MAKDELTPPYMSFGVFKSTIEQLAQSTVPSSPLDRRVLDQLSGADYGALMSGLRFLGYVDSDRRATSAYHELVHVSDDQAKFREFLLARLNEKYKPIMDSLDIQSGTAAELEKAFREKFSVPSGQMLTKTVRFFVKAMQECGIEVSTYITKARPRAPRSPARNGTPKPRRARQSTEQEIPPPHKPSHSAIPQGMDRMPIPGVPDAYVQYPENITEDQCSLFEVVIGVLRVYAKSRGGKAGKSS